MRYKATLQGQTASYSILLCHQEEKQWGTQQKEKYPSKKKKGKILSKPSRPLNVTVLYISTIEIQKWSTLWQIYFTGQKEREVQLHFIRQYFKSTGEETPVSTLLLLSTAQREPIASLLFAWAKKTKNKKTFLPYSSTPPFFPQILNRLKTKILHSKVCPLVPGVLDLRVPASCLRCVSRGWKLSAAVWEAHLFWKNRPLFALFSGETCGEICPFCCSLAVLKVFQQQPLKEGGAWMQNKIVLLLKMWVAVG